MCSKMGLYNEYAFNIIMARVDSLHATNEYAFVRMHSAVPFRNAVDRRSNISIEFDI